jgi:hypothetical protein
MEEKYYLHVVMQLNVFYVSKHFEWLNYVESPSTKKW